MMKKLVVISSNGNSDYLFYLPIVTFAWNKLGWEVLTMICNSEHPTFEQRKKLVIESSLEFAGVENYYINIPKVKGVREETLTQCARLYAANLADFNYLVMTSDADMLPLSNYWKPNPIHFTSYGRDLSDRHFPICYLAGSTKSWQTLMRLSGNLQYDMRQDLQLREDVHSDKFEDWWQVDQTLVSERLNNVDNNIDVARIDRGISPHTGYPIGRVDRSCWDKSFERTRKDGRIDAHLFREGYKQENWDRTMLLIREQFPMINGENIEWMDEYREQYIKLL